MNWWEAKRLYRLRRRRAAVLGCVQMGLTLVGDIHAHLGFNPIPELLVLQHAGDLVAEPLITEDGVGDVYELAYRVPRPDPAIAVDALAQENADLCRIIERLTDAAEALLTPDPRRVRDGAVHRSCVQAFERGDHVRLCVHCRPILTGGSGGQL